METSAKTAMNVNEIFMAIGEHLYFTPYISNLQIHWLCLCSGPGDVFVVHLFIYFSLFQLQTAKKLPKNEPQGGGGPGGRARGGVDLQEAAPQGRSSQCCGGGN